MKAKKILNSEISELKVSSLPTKPTAPRSMGGKGYGAKEMKEAFDKLPLFIIERFNALIEDIEAVGCDSLAYAIKTGLKDEHSLYDLFADIRSGEAATYLTVSGKSLTSHILSLTAQIEELKSKLEACVNTEVENV